MRKRLAVFFLIFIYIFNNIFVNTTLCRFMQEKTTEKFSLSVTNQKTLSDYSWQEIYDITVSGEAKDYWKVGDKTTVNVNGEDKEVVIIGFDHDGKNTVTFLFKDAVTIAPMNIEMTTVGGWKESDMRKITLPTILDSMENKDFIKEVEKNTIKGYTDGGGIVTGDIPQNAYDSISTTDKLFLLSYAEVFDSCYWDGEGVLYEYFNTTSNHIMTNENGNATWWWLRTPVINIEAYFYFVNSAGVSSTHLTNYSGSVMPAFVIGETTEEVNTLDLLPPFEMPEGFVSGESFIISEMPDFVAITENAIENTPENTEFYGWLLENEVTQEIFNLEDAKYILEDIYSYEEKYLLKVSPVYKMIEEPKLISVNIDNLEHVTVSNTIENSVSTEQNLILQFEVEEGYSFPETIEVVIDDISYIVNTNGNDIPEGFIFNPETLELIIFSNVLLEHSDLTINITANILETEEEQEETTEEAEDEVEQSGEENTEFEDTVENEESIDGTENIPEKISEKFITFETEQLYNIEITEFVDVDKNELVIEEDLELEFVLEEDYILHKNIEILIDETSYILDITNEEQELENISYDIENNILNIDFELFNEESTLVINAFALENILIDELLSGEEITITEMIEIEDLFDSLVIPDDCEFVGWLINDKTLDIQNIVIQENLNNVLTKIYENIKKEKELENENLEHLENVLEEDLEEIETLLIPVFRLIEKEELDLEGYVLGNETFVSEIPDNITLEEIITFGLTEELEFYGWLIETDREETIILPEELSEILNNLIKEESKEIIITPLYIVVQVEEQPEEGEENIESETPEEENTDNSVDNSEENTLPEDNSENTESSGDNVNSEEPDSDISVEEETDGIPDTSIPSEQILSVDINNLSNIDIPELSNENTISITENENLILSFIVEESYELPETVQVVVDKTYTINTNGEGNPEEIEYDVSTQKMTISYSILTDIDSIKIKGTAKKVQTDEEEKDNTESEKSEDIEKESSDEPGSAESETDTQSPVENGEEKTESENPEETLPEEDTDNSEAPSEEKTDGEADLEYPTEQEENVNSDTENNPENTNDGEESSEDGDNSESSPEESEETDNNTGIEEEKTINDNDFNKDKETEKETIENNVVGTGDTGEAESSAGVGEEKTTSVSTPESSPEPVSQSPVQTTTQNNSNSGSDSPSQNTTSNSGSFGSSPDNNSSTSQSVGTTTKKSESSEGKSESISSEE